MSATVEMALWLERNIDPHAAAALAFEDFRRAFPGATVDQLRAALELMMRALEDRLEGTEADLAAVRAVLRQLRGEG
jgi:hypothetical protein